MASFDSLYHTAAVRVAVELIHWVSELHILACSLSAYQSSEQQSK